MKSNILKYTTSIVVALFCISVYAQVQTIKYKDGSKYVGEVKNGLRSGKGTLYKTNDDVVSGHWENDKMNGKMEIEYHNGNFFVGFYKNDVREYGKMTFANGDVYEPQWNGDVIEGYGIYDFKNGDRYAGNYLNGKKHGEGVYNWSTGASFVGTWENGKRTGEGTLYYSDEDLFEIYEWDNDTITRAIGSIYKDENGEKVFDDLNMEYSMVSRFYKTAELNEEYPNMFIEWNSKNKTIDQTIWDKEKYVFFYPYSGSRDYNKWGYGFIFDTYIYGGILKSNSFRLERIAEISVNEVGMDHFVVEIFTSNNQIIKWIFGDEFIAYNPAIQGAYIEKATEFSSKADNNSIWNEIISFLEKIYTYKGKTKVTFASDKVKESIQTLIFLNEIF